MQLIGALSLPALALTILFFAAVTWILPFENDPEEPEAPDPK